MTYWLDSFNVGSCWADVSYLIHQSPGKPWWPTTFISKNLPNICWRWTLQICPPHQGDWQRQQPPVGLFSYQWSGLVKWNSRQNGKYNLLAKGWCQCRLLFIFQWKSPSVEMLKSRFLLNPPRERDRMIWLAPQVYYQKSVQFHESHDFTTKKGFFLLN